MAKGTQNSKPQDESQINLMRDLDEAELERLQGDLSDGDSSEQHRPNDQHPGGKARQ